VESVLREEEVYGGKDNVKQVGFKPGVIEWRSYGWWKWRINRGRRCDRRIGRGESILDRDPDWDEVNGEKQGAGSRNMVKQR